MNIPELCHIALIGIECDASTDKEETATYEILEGPLKGKLVEVNLDEE